MSRKQRINNRFQSFESKTPNSKHLRITHNMMDSDAWKDLSIHARYLYIEFKRKYAPGNESAISFTFTQGRTIMSVKKFSQALDELLTHGFLTLEYNGHAHRQKSLYAFSDQWQRWPSIHTVARVFTMPNTDNDEN